MRNLVLYLIGVGGFYTAFGLQVVLFPWLVAVYLQESPERVGLAQTCLLLPTLLLILSGGAAADRYGGRTVAVVFFGVAVLPALGLAYADYLSVMTYNIIILYALSIGIAQAFIAPARDALVNRIAISSIQNTVAALTGVQFSVQMIGFYLASLAETFGPLVPLLAQAVIYLLSMTAFSLLRLPESRTSSAARKARSNPLAPFYAIREGLAYVWQVSILRAILVMNFIAGMFLIGAISVGLTLIIREEYGGTPGELSLAHACLTCGTLFTTMIILSVGTFHRRGNWYVAAMILGALMILALSLDTDFLVLLTIMFIWGCGAGVLITMSRTIVQEAAPEKLRGRIMAAYIFGFLGGAPLGSAVMGLLIAQSDARTAMIAPGLGLLATALAVWVWSPIRKH